MTAQIVKRDLAARMTDYTYNLQDRKLDNFLNNFENRVGDSSGDIESDYFDMLRLLVAVKREGAILDIGAGTGRATAIAREVCGEVVALEPDKTRWKGTYDGYHKTPECTVLCQTSRDYRRENPEKRFDLIIIGWVLQHISTTACRALLEDAQALLKPDGICIIATTHTVEEAVGFSYAHAGPNEVYVSEAQYNAYAEDPASQDRGIPVRRFSKNSLQACLEPLFETTYWRQISYFRKASAEKFAKRLYVDPASLKDTGNTQFVVVQKKTR